MIRSGKDLEQSERMVSCRIKLGCRDAMDFYKKYSQNGKLFSYPKYQKHESGERPLNEKSAITYAKIFNVDWIWLLHGDKKHQGTTISIDVVDTVACCGNGRVNFNTHIIGQQMMTVETLHQITTVHPNNIKKVVRALEAAEEGNKVKDFATELQPTKDYTAKLIGLTRDRSELYDRINLRVDMLIEMGLLDEVKRLLDMGLSEGDISMKGIGYKEIIAYYHGEYDLEEAIRLVKKNTRRYAKRQLTWFRRYEDMQWFDISTYENDDNCLKEIFTWLEKN